MKRLHLITLLVFLSFIQASCFFDIFSNKLDEIVVVDTIVLTNLEGYNGNYVLVNKKNNGYYDVLIDEKIIELKKSHSTIYIKTDVSDNSYFYVIHKNNKTYDINKISMKDYILEVRNCTKCLTVKIPTVK